MEGDKYLEEDREIIITDADNPNFSVVRKSLTNLLKLAEEQHKKDINTLQKSLRALILYNVWKLLDEFRQKDSRKQSSTTIEENKKILYLEYPKINANTEIITNNKICTTPICPNLNYRDVEVTVHSTSQQTYIEELKSSKNVSMKSNEELLSSAVQELKRRAEILQRKVSEGDQMRTTLERSYQEKVEQLMKTEACLNHQQEIIMAERNWWKEKCELQEDKIQEMVDYSNRHSCEIKRILENSEFLEKENSILKSEIVISRADYREARSKIQDKEDLLQIERRLKSEVTEKLQRKICEQNKLIEQLEESNLNILQLKEDANKTTDFLKDKEFAINIQETGVEVEEQNASELLSYEPCKCQEEDEIGIKTKEIEDLQKQVGLYEVFPSVQSEKSTTKVTSANVYQSSSQIENVDFLKYQITSIEVVQSQDKIVDLLRPQDEFGGLLQSQSKISDLLQTLDKSDFLQSCDNISDLLESQANISGFLQSQGNSSVVLQSQDDGSDILQYGDESVDFLQSQEKSINLFKQDESIDNLRSENASSEILSSHNNEEKSYAGFEKKMNESESKELDKEVGEKIILEESILKILDQTLDICLDEAFIDNTLLINKSKVENKSEGTLAKKMETTKSSKPIKKSVLSLSLSKDAVSSNTDASFIDLTRNEAKHVQSKHKYKKKNSPRTYSDSTPKLQGCFKSNGLERTALSSPNTSKKMKVSSPLHCKIKSGSNVTANSNVTINIETGKSTGIDFIKRNVMKVSIFTKTSSKEDTNNTKNNSKPKVFTKRAKSKNIHKKARNPQMKAEKSLNDIDSKINETVNSLESNTTKTLVNNTIPPISEHEKSPSVPFNESLLFVFDDLNKISTLVEKVKPPPLNPKGVSKSDLDSLKDFIFSMSGASIESTSVHSELKVELPSVKNTTDKKLAVTFACEVKASVEKTASKDSIKNYACDINFPSVGQTSSQACEIFMPVEVKNSETSIKVDMVQEPVLHSPEFDLPKDTVINTNTDIEVYVSIQEPVNKDTTMQLYANEIVRYVRPDEGDSGSGEMVCLHILISYLTVYCIVIYTFYFLYFILFILFVYTVFTLRK